MSSQASDGAPDFKRLKRQPDQRVDRLPPSSAEAEQGILGCCLIDPNCIGRVIEAFKGSLDPMYDLRNQTILEALIGLYEDRDGCDVITLQYRLKAFDKLEQVGGIPYLSALPDAVPSAVNLDYYLEIVRDCYLRRKMIRTATEVVQSMYELAGQDLDEAMDLAERSILQVSESRVTQQQDTIRTIVQRAILRIEQKLENKGKISGLGTGFVDFDKQTDGLHPGEMILIAARPSVGKTSLAMNIADFVAVSQRLPVGVFSLEMTEDQLVERMICSRARVNLRNVREGFLADRDFPKLTSAAGKLAASPLYIDDEGGISILQLRAKARRMYQQYGIKLFVIDYLQLLHGLKAENRQQEVAQVSTGIKNLAKELKVPIIVACQLNRDIEREKNRRPRLADLRESGQQEADADLVTFLYYPGDESEQDPQREVAPTNWLIGKQRNGPAGVDVNLTFFKQYTRFESAAKITDADVQAQQQEFDRQ